MKFWNIPHPFEGDGPINFVWPAARAVAHTTREILWFHFRFTSAPDAGSVKLLIEYTGGSTDSVPNRTVTLSSSFHQAGKHDFGLPRLSIASADDGVVDVLPTGLTTHYEDGDPTLPSEEATWRKPTRIDLVSRTEYQIRLQAAFGGTVHSQTHEKVWYQIHCAEDEDCNNVGTCDVITGTCRCMRTYYGEFCQFKRCPIAWFNQLYGPDSIWPRMSEQHILQGNELEPVECSNNGKCDRGSGKCLCDHRYTGPSCEIRYSCPVSRSNDTSPATYESKGQWRGHCKGSFAGMDVGRNIHQWHQLDHRRDALDGNEPEIREQLQIRLDVSRRIDSEGPGVLPDNRFILHHDWEAHKALLTSAQYEGTIQEISCFPKYYGQECEFQRCPAGTHGLECSGNGLCNATTGRCSCFRAFYSTDCSRKRCPAIRGRVCNLHGICRGSAGRQVVKRLQEFQDTTTALVEQVESHDLVGTCACQYPYYGKICEYRMCPNDTVTGQPCAGHGVCMPYSGRCVCAEGYYSADCSRKTCPLFEGRVCNGQGVCLASDDKARGNVEIDHTLSLDGSKYGSFIDRHHMSLGRQGVCACRYPYYGEDCSMKHCPFDVHTGLNCSGHGTCNTHQGVCLCNSGWFSSDCSHKACPSHGGRVCNFHGACRSSYTHVEHHFSFVSSGYAESTTHHIQTQFNYGALWVTKQHSSWDNIVTDHRIERVTATSTDLIGTCHCTEPYWGPTCSKINCPVGIRNLTCSGNGLCNSDSGRCICQPEYFNADCSKRRCPTTNGQPCNSQGECVHTSENDHDHGTCTCRYPYHGPACEFKQCPNSSLSIGRDYGTMLECDGHGACDKTIGTCSCQIGYYGPDCSLKMCPMSSQNRQQRLLECNGEGRCDRNRGRCTCHSNFFHGDACDLRHCPSEFGLECSEHGKCNYYTGECRCDRGYQGPSCAVVGIHTQAPEIDKLDVGDHHSSGPNDNVYYPTGQCQEGQQVVGDYFFNEEAGLDFNVKLPLITCRTKRGTDHEKCEDCGNFMDQGSPGQVPHMPGAPSFIHAPGASNAWNPPVGTTKH